MANTVDTLVAKAPITCAADKFYDFFKLDMNDLVEVCGIPMTVKVKIDEISDAEKSITFTVLEGDLLLLYKSFKATLTTGEGLATTTFAFEKMTILTPPPELYVPLVITICTLVDAFLLAN
ncbi:Polyketide cyclase/dehydrase and lipid transport superfamily protein [Striga hermonthica]|uniref:Polyketide cyclase/dehydrase and lipid transport superfamily protein n=1 Tax=Striga hermonthica TaxID=68872 RepID=A0A9N7NVX9_STRHE|nr:Polyketide cyclase/dehydrase and lipid transport superfamily protein [Striga hermonthica]